jgi:(E)-4-hydroxy-3-methylbut-2-enyl-diphosphate synthase
MSHDIHHIRPWRTITRRKSRQIMVGKVAVGGDAPITVQTMTNTPPRTRRHDRPDPGSRRPAPISCASPAPTRSDRALCGDRAAPRVPVVADIHFHYKRAIEAAEAGAACLRINPGNIGSAERVREVVQAAKRPRLLDAHRRQCRQRWRSTCWRNTASPARRRWSNPRSITQAASCRTTTSTNSRSVKASDVFLAVAAYQQLAEATDCPLHLGITEAGG